MFVLFLILNYLLIGACIGVGIAVKFADTDDDINFAFFGNLLLWPVLCPLILMFELLEIINTEENLVKFIRNIKDGVKK